MRGDDKTEVPEKFREAFLAKHPEGRCTIDVVVVLPEGASVRTVTLTLAQLWEYFCYCAERAKTEGDPLRAEYASAAETILGWFGFHKPAPQKPERHLKLVN